MAEKLCALKKKGALGGGVAAIVPSGYFNNRGTVVQSPWTSNGGRGFGIIAGVQNATSLKMSDGPYTSLYKIKADGTVDFEAANGAHTYDVTDYDIVFISVISSVNFTAVCTIS